MKNQLINKVISPVQYNTTFFEFKLQQYPKEIPPTPPEKPIKIPKEVPSTSPSEKPIQIPPEVPSTPPTEKPIKIPKEVPLTPPEEPPKKDNHAFKNSST